MRHKQLEVKHILVVDVRLQKLEQLIDSGFFDILPHEQIFEGLHRDFIV